MAIKLDERIVPINLQKLALVVFGLCNDSSSEYVGVGNSSTDITQFWPTTTPVTMQSIVTIGQSQQRQNRTLCAQPLEPSVYGKNFIDDVAVSGNTLATARTAASPNPNDQAFVGMVWDSRRLRQRVAMPLLAAITYRQQGGGIPALNTLATFIKQPQVASDYARRKFGNETALKEITSVYMEEQS